MSFYKEIEPTKNNRLLQINRSYLNTITIGLPFLINLTATKVYKLPSWKLHRKLA